MEADQHRSSDPDRWREAVAPEAAQRLVHAIDTLADFPVLDGTVNRILAIADDPESTTADLVAVLESDPTFAANLLRLANSAAMARPIRAKTVRQAVMLVGRKALRRLALETATYRFLELAPGGGGARLGQMHLHAISVSSVTTATAELLRADGETLHLGGLLHDIGKLVLPIAFGAEACDEIAAVASEGPDRVLAERERFGIDHALAGALLAERWGLPGEVAAAIAWHHGGPTGVGTPDANTACVQIADQVVLLADGREPDHALLEVALERAGLPATALDALADHTVPSTGSELEAGAFARRVTELEHLSQTDELTGVDNRRHWLQTTRAALAGPDGEAGAVLVCDIDDLALLNERHGMRAGDMAMTEVARVLALHGRAGRLRGDLFGLWLRGGAGGGAEAVARIADAVAAAFAGRPDAPPVTVSLGHADASDGGRELAVLLEVAEERLRDAQAARPRPEDSGPVGTRAAESPVPVAAIPAAPAVDDNPWPWAVAG